jgi:flagellar basal-body rod protein FlgB
MGISLFDQTINFINHALDILTLRHKVISNNISNSDSPNYLRQEIPFKKILEHSYNKSSFVSLQKTHSHHFDLNHGIAISIQPEGKESNVDQEMARLAENQLVFQAGVQMLLKKLEALRITIQEGGK